MPTKAIRERSILVVDDEESVRMSLAAVLEREGYKVFTAEGKAIMMVASMKPVPSRGSMPLWNM